MKKRTDNPTSFSFRFIHCSDLHIDSPFKGTASSQPGLAERLRSSTLLAFKNIVDLALQEQVDAVIVAGDIFDGADKSLQAQLKFRRELVRLSAGAIHVFIAHGNHDPLNTWSSTLQWPEGVTVFEGSKVTGVPVVKDGKELAHIYGISFPQRDVFENLALGFEKNQKEGFAIGVLHANVGGNPDHDKYAPCALKDLASRGMDYWALGHIHLRQVLRESDPAIVYCGNPQAKNIKETGEKGCYLVTLNQGVAPDIQFKPTDALRFIADRVDLGKCTTLDQVIQAIQKRCEKIVSKTKDRDVVIRLTLEGRTAVHKELSKGGSLDDLQADAQYFFEGQEPFVWVELVLETQGEYDVDSLRQGQDFIADIISIYDDADQPQILEEIRAELQPLFESWPGRKYLENISNDELKGLLVKARNLSLDQMVDVD